MAQNPISPVGAAQAAAGVKRASSPGGDDAFVERLKSAVSEVNKLQHAGDDAAEEVIQGKMGIHEGMLALGKADTSLRLLLRVRGKALEAYRQIMNLQF